VCPLEFAQDSDIKAYLVDVINPMLDDARQFDEQSATEFVRYFGGNMSEIQYYVKSTHPFKGNVYCSLLFVPFLTL
jgi:hypothetical protein